MKKMCWVFAFAFFILQVSNIALAAEMKFSYVDIGKLFDEYERTKENDKQLQDEGQVKQKERDNMVQEIRRLRDEQAILAEDKKKQSQEVIDQKLKALDDFDQSVRKDLGERRNKIVNDIFQDIDNFLKKYGEREGYDFIFNDRALLHRNAKYDRTAQVIKELNAEYKKQKK